MNLVPRLPRSNEASLGELSRINAHSATPANLIDLLPGFTGVISIKTVTIPLPRGDNFGRLVL
jgi:hypothetical protein